MNAQTNDRCISISAHGEDSQATTGTRFATKHDATRRIIAICLAVSLVGCSGMSPRESSQSSDAPNTNVVAQSSIPDTPPRTERDEFEPVPTSSDTDSVDPGTFSNLPDKDAVIEGIKTVAMTAVAVVVVLPLMFLLGGGIH